MLVNVLVIKTERVEDVKAHFEAMGLVFVPEKHGAGPDHFACQIGERVLEIYPVGRDGKEKLLYLD
jgi:hypothetical protein